MRTTTNFITAQKEPYIKGYKSVRKYITVEIQVAINL